ncbi:MAG TPA: hypothetical protein VFW06_03735 [Acidimicrobiia bacterium]|nr:hypothetical protein [Acidimicrobiia bacterium]
MARPRPLVARVAGLVGVFSLLAGALAGWASLTLLDSENLAARSRQALEESESMRRVVARTLVSGVVKADRDLLVFQPILEGAAETVVASSQFGDVFESAVAGAHTFFSVEPTDNVLVTANEAVLLLVDTVRSISPEAAEAIPSDIEGTLIHLRDLSVGLGLWRIADSVGFLAWVLPAIGLAAVAAGILLAPDRTQALARLGRYLGVAGVVLVALARISGGLVRSAFDDPLTSTAAGDLWGNYIEGLRVVGVFGVIAGILVAAAGRATTSEGSHLTPAAIRTRIGSAIAREPRTALGKAGLAVGAGIVGLLLILNPSDAVDAALVALGAFVLYAALVYGLGLLVRPTAAVSTGQGGPGWVVGVASSLAMVLVVGAVAFLVFSSPEASAGSLACNGRIAYCDRRLDELALPTAHNAMSAADDGFLNANHQTGITTQLRGGVRGLLIDAYVGSRREGQDQSIVYTDLTDVRRTELEKSVGPELTARAEQLRESVGPPPDKSEQAVYLCHVFCELGSTRMRAAADSIRVFLESEPRDVLIVVIEDYADVEQIQAVLSQAGLGKYQLAVSSDEALPTLQEMIDSGKRLLVGLEKQDGGPKLPNIYEGGLVQETPYSFEKVSDLEAPTSCADNRGSGDAPLFLLNHWVTPQSFADASEVNSETVLGARAERCRTERGLLPNLVAIDFWETGDLFDVVTQLNERALRSASAG